MSCNLAVPHHCRRAVVAVEEAYLEPLALHSGRFNHKPDPYLEVSVDEHDHRTEMAVTKVEKKTFHPQWHEKHHVYVLAAISFT